MYISHSKKFVILRNRKCASTSLVNLVQDYCEVNWKTSEEQIGKAYSEIRHFTASQLKDLFLDSGWDLDDYLVIQTIRNPWDRVVSAFHYERDVVKNEKILDFTFEQYLNSPVFKSFVKNNRFENVAYDHVSNVLIPNKIIRVEDIDEELKEFSKNILNQTFDKLEKKNTTQRKDYREYYTEETRELIARCFSRDIEIGKYKY